MRAIDLFGGPGGFDLGARALGIDPLGLEDDDATVATRHAAGLRTVQADVSKTDPYPFGPVDLLIASPPCPPFSQGGLQNGFDDLEEIYAATRAMVEGTEWPTEHKWADARSELLLEPLRWALALNPHYIVLEQVPPVLEYWRVVADYLRDRGYGVWTGILEAERYGVPQTRERAFLLAEFDGAPAPPIPTNQRYVPGEEQRHEVTLEGAVLPWVSMAEALGWDEADLVGFPREADELEAVEVGGSSYRARDLRPAAEPAFSATEKARSWQRWPTERPATTVQGDPRIFAPGRKGTAAERAEGRHNFADRAGTNAVVVTEDEAAVLQGFPRGYPWQGTRTKRFLQIGNAVPPPLAEAVFESLIGADNEARLAA